MPQAVAAIGSIVSAIGGFLSTTTIAGVALSKIVTTVAVTIGASVLSSVLQPKPRRPGGSIQARNSTLAIRQSNPSRRIPYGVTRLGGIYTYAETVGSDLWLVMTIADGPIVDIDKLFLDGVEVPLETNGNDSNGRAIWEPTAGNEYAGFLTLSKYTGAAGQPADAQLIAASAGNWTANHVGIGIAYAVLKVDLGAEPFSNALPNISFEITGRNDVYDPRGPSTGYSDLAALCLNHWMTTDKSGPNADYATEIDEAALITAANVCDEAVNLKAGGDENRYTVNGYVDTADDPDNILEDFNQSMAGWTVYAAGRFVPHAGAYVAPTFEITEDMLAGPVKLTNQTAKRNRINTVRGVYLSPESNFQPTDFPAQTVAAYVTEDGEEIAVDLELPFTTSPATAQRIAKSVLERGRLHKTLELVCNARAIPAVAGHAVKVTLPRYSFSEKVFLVESSSVGPLPDGTIGIGLKLREYASSVWTWDETTDEKTIAAVPSLTVGPPTVANITADPDGGNFSVSEFPVLVSLSTPTTDAVIRWSKVAMPTDANDGEAYIDNPALKPLLYEGETLYSKAFKPEFDPSDGQTDLYRGTFSPPDISGLEYHFRADIPGEIYGNGGFSHYWDDWTDNHDAFQQFDVQTPIYNEAARRQFFDGDDDSLDCATPDLSLPKSIVLFVTNSDAPDGVAFSLSSNTHNNRYVELECAGGDWLGRERLGATNEPSGGVAASPHDFEIVIAVLEQTRRRCYVSTNGSAFVADTQNDNDVTPDNLTHATIGAHINGSSPGLERFFKGNIHEILVYGVGLTSGDRENLRNYGIGKYIPPTT